MDIIEYQNNIRNFIDYPVEVGPYSVILSLSENIGILSGKLNKVLKENRGQFSKEDSTKAAITLGDILFDICNLASDLKINMNDIISLNLLKHQMEQDKKNKKIV